MLELRQFQVLRAIAREGSLAAAARSLHYSQPTIAHHLAAIESHFGAPLVHRGPRGVRLTEAGRLVLPHAEAVLGRVGLVEREVRALVEQGARSLHVGTFPTAGALLLPPAVRELAQEGVRVQLVEGELPTVVEALRTGAVQIALVYSQPGEPLDLGEEFALHHLLDDPLLLALPADHPLAALDRVPLGELRDEGWIMGASDWDPCDRVLSWACAQEGFEPVRVMRTDDYGMLKGFVAAGTAVALIPRLALTGQESALDLAVRPVAGPALARRVSVAMLRATVSDAAETLREALSVQARTIEAAWRAHPLRTPNRAVGR
ncbi:LysR family transcriptional regulator [Streptacidiphilus sp. NEAU-YB345]|uniref:LysR family transcriptional regulator n=1 Tax=Streptacidiphilus fuscans TaxID=2789292 RepID=A0A931BD56_9ACTN|nr:LysR family transcriptional regulator [Streptacidiphilus fuscans]MBF9073411.1 LysR family transcriptional regulator [Streptacidiphilus fuscans]